MSRALPHMKFCFDVVLELHDYANVKSMLDNLDLIPYSQALVYLEIVLFVGKETETEEYHL